MHLRVKARSTDIGYKTPVLRFVEIASACILALCAGVQARSGPEALRRFLRDALLIGVSGWLAEDVCIRLFDFYAYARGWMIRADHVPLLIGCIWPFVVLSARDVARVLGGTSPLWLRTGVVILFDAALIEPVAVRAGLWSWSEPGVLGVPLIGIAGWAVFGAICVAFLEWCDARRGALRWTLPLVATMTANALLVVLWWGAFRWGPRFALSDSACIALSALGAVLFCARVRELRGAAPLELMLVRAVAASLFFVLIALRGHPSLWAYALPFAAPYLWLSARLPGRVAVRT